MTGPPVGWSAVSSSWFFQSECPGIFFLLRLRSSWSSHYISFDDGQLVESRWSGPALDVLWWVVGGQGRRGGRSEVEEIEGD